MSLYDLGNFIFRFLTFLDWQIPLLCSNISIFQYFFKDRFFLKVQYGIISHMSTSMVLTSSAYLSSIKICLKYCDLFLYLWYNPINFLVWSNFHDFSQLEMLSVLQSEGYIGLGTLISGVACPDLRSDKKQLASTKSLRFLYKICSFSVCGVYLFRSVPYTIEFFSKLAEFTAHWQMTTKHKL